MERQVYRVDAWLFDETGAYHKYSDDYPKNFDSLNYNNNIETARLRAEGDMSSVWADMCTKDNRLVQAVTLCTADGSPLDYKTRGAFPEI